MPCLAFYIQDASGYFDIGCLPKNRIAMTADRVSQARAVKEVSLAMSIRVPIRLGAI